MTVTPQLTALLVGLAGVIGATVAVCLGQIDAPTYIGVVGPVLGVGVGAGVHASGANIANGTSTGAGSGGGSG